MYFIYNCLLLFLCIFYLPYLVFKAINGKTAEIREQLGFLPQSLLKKIKDEPVVWIHGVSVGETVASRPLCTELRKLFPHYKMIFSTTTKTGQEMARKVIEADAYFYFPFDFPWVIRKVFSLIKPKLVVIMETELWPNFLRTAHGLGCKVVLANGRISDRSLRGYKRIRAFTRTILSWIDAFIMQSRQDVERILALGADKQKVFYFGNTKYDQYDLNSEEFQPAFKIKLAKELQVEGSYPVLVVGSTHDHEEESLIPVYKRLKVEYPNLVMILAPRHLERINEIQHLYQKAGIVAVRRTELKHKKRNEPVIFLDTIGELFLAYCLADLVFIGGTLVEIGGHNILEPAAYGKVIFVGPHMFNFNEILKLFLAQDACIQVQDVKELEKRMLACLKNPEESRIMGQNALKIISENQGAAQKSGDLVAQFLNDCSY